MPTKPSPDYTKATQMAFQDDAARLAANDSSSVPVPPPDSTQTLTPAEKAERLRDLGPAIHLYGTTAPLLGETIDVAAWKIFVDNFLAQLGAPCDPVTRMMAEQLALAHHALAHLHVRAATRLSPQAVAAFNAAIARLMAEFRRTALAMKSYREGRPSPEANSPQTEAKSASGEHTLRRKKKSRRTKQASTNRLTEFLDECKPVLS